MPTSADDFERLHRSDTASTLSKKGVVADEASSASSGARRGGGVSRPAASLTREEWSDSADALFRQVLDGICDTALVEYTTRSVGKRCPPSSSSSSTAAASHDTARQSRWSFSGAVAKVAAEMKKEAEATPGVGSYEAPRGIGASSSGHRIPPLCGSSGKKTRGKVKGTVGPGSYNTLNDRAVSKRSPSPVTMALPTKSKKKPEPPTPGPGAYAAQEGDEAAKKPRAVTTMGTAKKYAPEKNRAPGPGQYNVAVRDQATAQKGKWRASKSTVVCKKTKEDPLPGPGAYDTCPASEAPPSDKTRPGLLGTAATGRLPTPTKEGASFPGPGHYVTETGPGGLNTSTTSAHEKGYSFGTAVKEVTAAAKESKTPGPGAYAVEGDLARSGRGVAAMQPPLAPDGRKRDPSPGPGAYQLAAPPSTARQATIGTEVRKDLLTDKEAAHIPGPGSYANGDMLNTSGHAFPKAQRETEKRSRTASPGPGTYAVADQGTHTAVTIGTAARSSRHFDGSGDAPGPGAYETRSATRDAAPSAVMGLTEATHRGSIQEHEKSAVPGPGAYDVSEAPRPESSLSLWKGGTAQRGLVEAHADTSLPGPGAYCLDGLADAAAPAGVIGKASTGRTTLELADTPGPGHYAGADSDGFQNGVRIGTAQRSSLPSGAQEDVPGPGTYDYAQGTVAGGGDAPAALLRLTELRSDPAAPAGDTPGPGHYGAPPTTKAASGVVFGTSNRPSATPDEVPGPGHYSHTPLDGGPAFTFPKERVAAEGAAADVPGPGAYVAGDGASSSVAPTVVFGTANRGLTASADDGSAVPGPGAYDVLQTKEVAGPTMGVRCADTPLEDTPGPGHYSAAEVSASNGVKIGTEPRTKPAGDSKGPGPGSYDARLPGDAQRGITMAARPQDAPPSSTPGPGAYYAGGELSDGGVVMGTAPRGSVFGEDDAVPGPGAYDALRPSAVPGGLIAGRVEVTAAAGGDAPGPGAYDLELPAGQRAGRNIVIGTSSRALHGEAEDTPGPGHYDTAKQAEGVAALVTARPSYTTPLPGADAPGPGHYETPGLPQGATCVVGGGTAPRQLPLASGADVPGPGHYAEAPLPQGPSATLGTTTKAASTTGEELPGPGSYDVAEPHGGPRVAGGVIGTATRTEKSGDNDTAPGPGSYAVESGTTGPSAVFGTTPAEQATQDAGVPGPGHYASEVASRTPAVVIGTTTRMPSAVRDMPGPGAYSVAPPSDSVGKSFVIQDRPVDALCDDLPGPGHYDVERKDAGPKIAIGTAVRLDGGERESVPGPGTYDVCVDDKAAGGVIAKAGRDDPAAAHDAAIPGPGTYSAVSPAATHGAVMGTEVRSVPWDGLVSETPGPGAYEPHRVRPDGPATVITTAPRTDAAKADPLPGPGHYDPTASSDAPAHVIGTAPRTESNAGGSSATPGPGAYVSGSPLGQGAPAASFPKSVRVPNEFLTGAEAPGPGAYSLRPGDTGPSAVIGGRDDAGARAEQVRTAETPGPGAYAVTALREAPSAVLTGSSATFEPDATPGPGAYAAVPASEAPKVSIGVRRRDPLSDAIDQPGPGHYSSGPAQRGPAVTFPRAKTTAAAAAGIDTPGPGTYKAAPLDHGVRVSIGGALPNYAAAFQPVAPGPGTYDAPPGERGPQHTFGKAQGEMLGSADGTPGPGEYHNPRHNAAGTQVPSFSIASGAATSSASAAEPGPGPGEYHNPRHGLAGARTQTANLSSGGHARSASVAGDTGPGPGQYHRPTTAGEGAPRMSIGGSGGSQRRGEAGPGPGEYHKPKRMGSGAPAARIIGRPSSAPAASVPGPGAYKAASQPRRGSSFGRPPKPAGPAPDRPGPGDYYRAVPLGADAPAVTIAAAGARAASAEAPPQPSGSGFGDLPQLDHGPAYTFGRRDKERPDAGGPGPGAYDVEGASRRASVTSQAPAVSLRRTSSRMPAPARTPGPGDYEVP
eukprot:Rhum_TRINITY_DN13619_c0_g1::Rhum_TRINITY_DN13619_c0_g1_i2::g.62051::m.62051